MPRTLLLQLSLCLASVFAWGACTTDSVNEEEPPNVPDPDPPAPVPCEEAIDFEDDCGPFEFTDFGGAVTSIIDNPDATGINTTAKVTRSEKFRGESFAGTTLTLDGAVDWSQGTAFAMKVWSPRPVNVLFKLEGLDEERPSVQTGSSSWEELCFDFADSTDGPDVELISIFFDIGRVGDAANDQERWTFYFDGIRQTDGCEVESVEYELVFADEFNTGTQPSSETWNFETGYGFNDSGWGNDEWQLYTDSPDNVRIEDGNLVISALCPETPCGVRDGTVTSARITTQGKFSFKFGRVEARIKPPVGQAAWPAFWSLGANFPTVGWPRSGEIDFMEMHNAFSDDRTTHFTVHWCDAPEDEPDRCLEGSPPPGRVFYTQNKTFDESLGDDFHLFEAEWDESQIVGKIDGIEYFRTAIDPLTMEEFLREFFLILNVAMGGSLGSNNRPPNGTETFPQTMLVDYVRVYRRVDATN